MDHSDKKGKNIIDIQESNRSLVLQILTENAHLHPRSDCGTDRTAAGFHHKNHS